MGLFDFLKNARDERKQKAAEEAERQLALAEEERKRKATEEAERQHKTAAEAERKHILAEEEREQKAAEEAERKLKAEEAIRVRAEIEKKLIEEKKYFEVDKERWMLYMRLIEEIEKIATQAAADKEAKRKSEEAAEVAREKHLSTSIAPFFPRIDQALRDAASLGSTHLDLELRSDNNTISVLSKDNNGHVITRGIIGGIVDSSKDKQTVATLIAMHYREEGFAVSSNYTSAYIMWETEQQKQQQKQEEIARAVLLKARIDQVQTALLLGSFISQEGTNGNITNYVMHTIRLTYVDGKKNVISIRESDPFFYGIIDKLEN